MKRSFDQLVGMLAASGLSERAMYEALQELMRIGPGHAVDRIMVVRSIIPHLMTEGGRRAPVEGPSVPPSTLDRIVEMLTREANLPAADAAELLSIRLSEKFPATKIPTFRPKDGLRKWLNQLAKTRSTSEIMHLATRIRNEVVHRPTLQWSIGPREDD